MRRDYPPSFFDPEYPEDAPDDDDQTSPGHGGAGQTAAGESQGAGSLAADERADGEGDHGHTDAPGNRGTAIDDPEDELAAYLRKLDPAVLAPCQRRYLGLPEAEADSFRCDDDGGGS